MEKPVILLAADENGSDKPENEVAEAMAKHGITCVPVNNFCYGGYRYTNLQDAIVEAKRHSRTS
jgi:hypothetical protein